MGRPSQFDRDAAVETALDAFWRDGFEASSVKSLSEQLGITRSSFYNAFGSREALFEETLDLYATLSPDKAFLDVPADTPILPLLTRTFREICRVRASDPEARGCVFINTVTELGGVQHPVGRALAGLLLCRIEAVEGLLERAVAQKELPAGADTAGLALAMQNLIIGLNVMCKVMPDEERLWLTARTTLQGLGLYASSEPVT